MIKIEKRSVVIDKNQLVLELKRLAQLYAQVQVGMTLKDINTELGCRLLPSEFLGICKDLGISLFRGKVILFRDINQLIDVPVDEYTFVRVDTDEFLPPKQLVYGDVVSTKNLATLSNAYGHRVQIVEVTTSISKRIQIFDKQYHGQYENCAVIMPEVLDVLKTL